MAYALEEISAPSFEITDTGSTATRKLRLADWGDVAGYVNGIVPSTFPGKDSLKLKAVKVEAFEPSKVGAIDSDGVATCAAGAEITLEYATTPIPDGDDQDPADPTTWMTHDVNVQQQYITHANSALKWATGDPQVQEDVLPGFPMTIINHELAWPRTPNPPIVFWNGFVGKCNSEPFLGHAAEMVIFSGYSASRQALFNGTSDYEVKMTFQARIIHSGSAQVIGWNHFLRPGVGGGWERIISMNGDKVIPTANLNLLF